MTHYLKGNWDLSELSPDHHSPQFNQQFEDLEEQVQLFEQLKSQLKHDLQSDIFSSILRHYEEIIEAGSKIRYYARLLFSANTSDPDARALVAQVTDFTAKITNRLLFFTLWWKKGLDEKNATRLIKDANELGYYLTRLRTLAKYTLTEAEEKIINIKDTTGINFIRKLYNQYTNRFIFPMNVDAKKKEFTKPELVSLFRSPNPQYREGAYQSLLTVYGQNADILGELYRSVVYDWKNEGIDLRGYTSPISVRNISNDVPDQAVKTLLTVCQDNASIFQDYFQAKAKLLGMEKMHRYHIYAPLETEEKHIPLHTAVDLVLNALEAFSPTLSRLAQKVLDEQHLDSEIRKGKRSGAFCATVSPHISPYVLINYANKLADVFTLAHELGHAVHSLLAADKSILVQQAPLPLAELASVFAEILVLDNVQETATDEERKGLLVSQLDDLYGTILRQAYFSLFENKVHTVIPEGVTVSAVSDLYLSELQEQFGDAVEVSQDFRYEWTYIPHFYHTPFYTYAYAFGNLLTLALYQEYRQKGEGFVTTYLDILSSGGSKSPMSLLQGHGINIMTAEFWQNGFSYIKERVNELKRL